MLANKENTLPTYHPQIMIAKLKEYDADEVLPEINMLIENAIEKNDNFELVKNERNCA